MVHVACEIRVEVGCPLERTRSGWKDTIKWNLTEAENSGLVAVDWIHVAQQ
jgi:hypothetical protein